MLFGNRITQHYAVDNHDGLPRRPHRVTVAGDVPVGIDGRASHSIEGNASHCTSVVEQAADALKAEAAGDPAATA
ncbi:hypothetical protein GCM10027162_62280 [Streptomyces incanus]